MPNIKITVAEKIATNTTPGEVIVCNNKDYTITFDLDAEWATQTARTARFVYYKDGLSRCQDVVFSGDTVNVPQLDGVDFVLVGVYAGDLHTTTPAKVLCDRSILCGASVHEDPPEDVYLQLLALINSGAMQGPPGHTPVKGVDYCTPEDRAELEAWIVAELAKRGQLKPEFANSIEECTDTSKLYVLPDGYLYTYMQVSDPGGKPLFTNLAKPETANDAFPNTALTADEWLNGYQISNKNIVAKEGVIVTNKIPVVKADTIRITGIKDSSTEIHLSSSVRNFFKVLPCDANGTALLTEVKPAFNTTDGGSTGRLEQMDPEELAKGIYCFSPQNDKAHTYWNNVAYIRVCGVPMNGNSGVIVTVNEEIAYTQPTTGYMWASTGHAFVPADYEDRIRALEQAVEDLQKNNEEESDPGNAVAPSTDSVEILLPSEAVAVVGVEFNIYHRNVILCSRPAEQYDVRWSINSAAVSLLKFAECLRIVPTAASIGAHTLTVKVCDAKTGDVYAEKSITLRIIANTAAQGKNVLFIGDSLTFSRNGLYAAEIQYNLSNGGLVSIGSQVGSAEVNGIGEVRHEGYNGAPVGGFLAEKVVGNFTNPFYNPATGSFDLAYFLSNQGYNAVDAVCLNLGHNNIGNHANAVAGLNTIISNIHGYDANIPIIVSLITPLAGQDAWANKAFTAAQMRSHWRNLISAYIAAFDKRAADNVHLSTPYFCIDVEHDFPTETVARSARDGAEIVRQSDPMHPGRIGTLKMADTYYAYLLDRVQ